MPVTCTPDNLASLGACFTGLSPSQQSAAQIRLLCQIAGLSICGAVTTQVTVFGAGTTALNGAYSQTNPNRFDAVDSSGNNIILSGGRWRLRQGTTIRYEQPVGAEFPCGLWTTVVPALDPAPTVAYT